MLYMTLPNQITGTINNRFIQNGYRFCLKNSFNTPNTDLQYSNKLALVSLCSTSSMTKFQLKLLISFDFKLVVDMPPQEATAAGGGVCETSSFLLN